MKQRKLLVTGATGSTGKTTVRLLREKGLEVRAFVHSEDARSQALQALGAEVVVGDLSHFESVRSALDGTQGAYFVYPIQPGILQATAYFAQAAKEAGVDVIVNMSQISARREAKSHAAQDHWIAERILDWSGVPSTHLRPTLFAEWLLYMAPAIKMGKLVLPFGTGKHAPIAADDQAAVIANILADPKPHEGKIYPLYGPTEMTFAETAAEAGRGLGRPVGFESMEMGAFIQMSKSRGMDPGDFFWQHITEIAKDHQNGVFSGTNDLVQTIGGHAPMTVFDFVQKHRQAFAPGA